MRMIFLLLLIQASLFAQSQTKIIDMHVHSYTQSRLDKGKPYIDYYGVKGTDNADKLMAETFEAFKKYNIVKAMVSGSQESVEMWAANDKAHRLIRGIAIDEPDEFGLDLCQREMNQKPCLLTRRKFGMAPVHRDPPDEEGSTLKGWGEAIIFWTDGLGG